MRDAIFLYSCAWSGNSADSTIGVICSGAQASKAPRGIVTGTATDALGRPLKGANVELQNSAGKVVARTKSDDEGHFTFAGVAPGVYAVVATKLSFKPATSIVSVAASGAKRLTLALQSETALSLQVATTRINPQPNAISETGTSQYTLTEHNIASLPQGVNTPINEVLLQMPGVVQDDEAQVHVDGEHEDLQWRVNGVMMPMDSFTGFGQIFNSFFVKTRKLARRHTAGHLRLPGCGRARYGDKGRLLQSRGECGILWRAAGMAATELRVWRM